MSYIYRPYQTSYVIKFVRKWFLHHCRSIFFNFWYVNYSKCIALCVLSRKKPTNMRWELWKSVCIYVLINYFVVWKNQSVCKWTIGFQFCTWSTHIFINVNCSDILRRYNNIKIFLFASLILFSSSVSLNFRIKIGFLEI